MGGLFTHQGRCGAQGMSGHIPDRRQQGGARIVLENQGVEGVEMVLFVGFHLFQLCRDASLVRQFAEHGALALIDRHGAVFTGMVDPNHLLDAAGVAALAGQGGAGSRRHFESRPFTPTKMDATAKAAEIKAL